MLWKVYLRRPLTDSDHRSTNYTKYPPEKVLVEAARWHDARTYAVRFYGTDTVDARAPSAEDQDRRRVPYLLRLDGFTMVGGQVRNHGELVCGKRLANS